MQSVNFVHVLHRLQGAEQVVKLVAVNYGQSK